MNIFLRHGGSTAVVAGLAIRAMGGSPCFVNGESFTFSTMLAESPALGRAICSITIVTDEYDLEERIGAAIEPYTHELHLVVRGADPDSHSRLTVSQSWHAFRLLQTLRSPLLLTDEGFRAYADYLPGRQSEVRLFSADTMVDGNSSEHWNGSLYHRPPLLSDVGGNRHSIVAFATDKLLCIAPATESGRAGRPTFAVLRNLVPPDLILQVADAAARIPEDNKVEESTDIYGEVARLAEVDPGDIVSAPHVVIPPDVKQLDHFLAPL